ncbi:AraC family transcriptional regulator [Variovorax sp. OV329]|uniref:helix-turn-helix domain-containing protein n=1 Tax=Variovorax sp. OV329 TaxID=1882825 RepID=UPI0008ECAF56|nr:AraC family transcriptional regulator [Variovorax sp. OV329]SFN21835.1 transcriptional regulator, AraC family [Variovorax sp. OV329]
MHIETKSFGVRTSSREPAGAPAPLPDHSTGPKDTLGCASNRLLKDQEISAAGIRIYRKATESTHLEYVETPATDRGVLIGISLGNGHRRRIVHERRASCHEFNRGDIYIRHFCDRYRADLESSFDFVMLEMSQAAIKRAIEDRDGCRVSALSRVTAEKDDVLIHLALALTPALDRPAETSLLFVEQMSVAMGSYLLEKYGGAPVATMRKRRLLSRPQEALAKEMLRSKLDASISITDIANACNLSRSYFIHAFRETTGQTPHQWLVAERLAHARTLLMEVDRPLTEIAAVCGFADQSHFTRVFARSMGTPPGAWRRGVRLGS